MRLDEIIQKIPLLEMAYDQQKAEQVMTGLEKPINDHLLKIWAMPQSEHLEHWTMEVVNWCEEIGEIILKPKGRRPKKSFYYRILFDEPFGQAELTNIASRLRRINRTGGYNINPSVVDLYNRLKEFHIKFSEKCSKDQVSESDIRQLLGVI